MRRWAAALVLLAACSTPPPVPTAGRNPLFNPAVSQGTIAATICVPGWTAKVRPPTLTDGTNLDVAADAIAPWYGEASDVRQTAARAALDGIDREKKRLADLTPDDVTAIFAEVCFRHRWESGEMIPLNEWKASYDAIAPHAWDVLSR